MLRLDPAHLPLWRSPTAVQLGTETDLVIIDDPSPWQQRLLRVLEAGIPETALESVATRLGAPDAAATAFVAQIAAALARPSPTAGALVVQVPAEFDPAAADALAQALCDSGWQVTGAQWLGSAHTPVTSGLPVVVVGTHVIEPHRAAWFMRHDIVHIPAVFTGSSAHVGPVITPGTTACLACVAAHRRDADPAWPLLCSQLIGRPAPAVPAALAVDAGLVAGALLTRREVSGPGDPTSSVSLQAGSVDRRHHAHRPHAQCRCRSLAESATERDPGALETTTATAFDRPA